MALRRDSNSCRAVSTGRAQRRRSVFSCPVPPLESRASGRFPSKFTCKALDEHSVTPSCSPPPCPNPPSPPRPRGRRSTSSPARTPTTTSTIPPRHSRTGTIAPACALLYLAVFPPLTLSLPSSSEGPVKLSKSALKKQKLLARVEKRQQEKAARAAARAQAAGATPAPAPAATESTPAVPVQSKPSVQAQPPTTVPAVTAPVVAAEPEKLPVKELVQPPSKPVAPKPANGVAPSKEATNGSTPQVSASAPAAPSIPPPSTHNAPSPVEAKPVAQPAPSSAPSEKQALAARRNDIENPPVEKQHRPSPADVEKAKKKSGFLTRTLWTFIMIGGFISRSISTQTWVAY